ncbi:MAG: 30S ribosome-binding factor RbfA [Endomicrobia bacterium]|nr:30S ribosome-binding factor RbfA [Endomicrobiia bacterium]
MKNLPYSRSERIKKQIHKEVANIVSNLKDPRAHTITITEVEVTSDLRIAKVYYSVLDDNIQIAKMLFESAKGYIRSSLAKKLQLKHAIEVEFLYDKFLEKTFKVLTILDKIKDETHQQE